MGDDQMYAIRHQPVVDHPTQWGSMFWTQSIELHHAAGIAIQGKFPCIASLCNVVRNKTLTQSRDRFTAGLPIACKLAQSQEAVASADEHDLSSLCTGLRFPR
jgi:hypothetical protein